ncbi:Negatively light-regulated [Chlorella sorokiniana]|uniref:Negatively light-regulated n=1 Tax=Chlorella sorokiniana TaxID=3076 RepID=A0A2P6TTV7_CHLSO|nr:Negatively light-regulated [Chlorella sorokiniana]|eukprot:PRW57500.1 Negatively light-regulated [Chlorella sorokiniana]
MSQPGTKQPTAAELSEAEQEALLRAKYGGLLKKKPLLPQDRKHFDSADWQLSKQGVPAERPQLEPKLNPTVPPARRSSQLGDGQ